MPETPEMVERVARGWGSAVAPIIAKLEAAALTGQDTIIDATGSDMLATLLKGMASHLDAALAAPEEGREP